MTLDANYQTTSIFTFSITKFRSFKKLAKFRGINSNGFVYIWNNWLNIGEDMYKNTKVIIATNLRHTDYIVSIKITELH